MNFLIKLKKINIGPINIIYYGNMEEFAFSVNMPGYKIEEEYLNPNDEDWSLIDINEVKAMLDGLSSIMIKFINIPRDGENIRSSQKLVSELEDYCDYELSNGDLFSGELYNGWDYENYKESSHWEGVVNVGMYALAKCAIFMKEMNNNKIK